MIDYSLFVNAVHNIALTLPPKNRIIKGWTGKRPAIRFDENPRDYRGLGDKKYGTAFETTYIKDFNRFFAVLDIDDYKESDYNVMGAIPDSILATHKSKTQSGGLHLYLLSETPLELRQIGEVPLDLKCIRKNSFEQGRYGGLVVGDWCYRQKYDEFEGYYYVKKFYQHNNEPLLEVDINNVVDKIYCNLSLESEKLKNDSNYTYDSNYVLTNPNITDRHRAIAHYLKNHESNWYENVYYMGFIWGLKLGGVLKDEIEAEAVATALMNITPYHRKDDWIKNFVHGYQRSDKNGWGLGENIINDLRLFRLIIKKILDKKLDNEELILKLSSDFKDLNTMQYIKIVNGVI